MKPKQVRKEVKEAIENSRPITDGERAFRLYRDRLAADRRRAAELNSPITTEELEKLLVRSVSVTERVVEGEDGWGRSIPWATSTKRGESVPFLLGLDKLGYKIVKK